MAGWLEPTSPRPKQPTHQRGSRSYPRGMFGATLQRPPPMSVPFTGTLVRTGQERATLVRRTYGLVFISVIATALGAAFGLTQPALMRAVARHPIISMLAMFAPLFMAMQARRSFPRNI